jgi:hypothetical protein
MSAVAAGFVATVHRCDGCHGIACQDDALLHLQRQWFLRPQHDLREIDPGQQDAGHLTRRASAIWPPPRLQAGVAILRRHAKLLNAPTRSGRLRP